MRMFTQVLVRTRVSPLSLLRDVRSEIVQIDREQQVMRVRDLEAWITGLPEYSQQRLVAILFAVFSVMALILAAAGLYSVVSYGVATRTNEFGIRMALGAKAARVFRIVLSSTAVHNCERQSPCNPVYSLMLPKHTTADTSRQAPTLQLPP